MGHQLSSGIPIPSTFPQPSREWSPGRRLRVKMHEHVIKSREETCGIYAFLRHLPEIMALPL